MILKVINWILKNDLIIWKNMIEDLKIIFPKNSKILKINNKLKLNNKMKIHFKLQNYWKTMENYKKSVKYWKLICRILKRKYMK